jgi:two-component system NtrC family sensor kinase
MNDFDREYDLNELLSLAVVEELCTEIQKVAPISIALLLQNGTICYPKSSIFLDYADTLSSIINQDGIDSPKTFDFGRRQAAIFPISHQLETIGYLVMCHETNASYPLIPLGVFLLKTFTRLITYKYKYELTAGLHEQVVEESYARLKDKAVLLEKSELRYRRLAENLEIEVQKKTRMIKEAQAHLMQQEKMASIGHLAAGVAHEINNPMGFINSNLNSLKDYMKDIVSLIQEYRSLISKSKDAVFKKEDRISFFDELKRINELEKEVDIAFILQDTPNLIEESLEGATRIKKIVVDLKDFSHPGKEELKHTDINENLNFTLNVVQNEIKYKATVTKNYGELPLVKCYTQQISQVFMNILVNAAQAIEEKGDIKVETRLKNGFVEIIISDTGVGIPTDILSKIFDPFFTTKEVGKGSGLGLNVAYNIMKKHNGTIDVKSSVGKGTTFIARLPVDD